MLHEGIGQRSAFGLMDVVLDGVESCTSEQPAPCVMLWKTFPPAPCPDIPPQRHPGDLKYPAISLQVLITVVLYTIYCNLTHCHINSCSI